MSEIPVFACKTCGEDRIHGIQRFNQHCSSSKHMNKLPLYITITVKAFCNNEQIKSIHEYFEKFGTIIKHEETVEGDHTLIDYYFQNPKVYTNILHKDHELFDKKLEISWSKTLASISYFTAEDRISVLNSMKECKTFFEQVLILQNSLLTTSEADMKIIHADLTELLTSLFPTHQIHFVGSRTTGLAFKWSYLDIYLSDVALNTLKELIKESENFFPVVAYNEKFASSAIKCIHTRTQTSCILNIKDKLCVANTKLVKYYLTLDKKLKWLMIIIKFWTECHKLSKSGLSSGYALCLMVIFFLQQEPYNLPSVYDLQKACRLDMEGAFSTPEREFLAFHCESLLNLVVGFFRFYSNFDYVTQMVCPYLGTAVKKTAFVRPYDLPDSYQQYCTGQHEISRLTSALCVQDPLEHNRNVLVALSTQNTGRFAVMCQISEQCVSQKESDLLYGILKKIKFSMMAEISFTIQKDDSTNEQEWFASLKSFTEKVLKEIIYCQINQEIDSDNVQVLNCVCLHNAWFNRVEIYKALEQRLPPETNDFDRELVVMPYILEYCPQVFDANDINPQFSFVLTKRENPCRGEFLMKVENHSGIYWHLSHYFRRNFPHWWKIAGSTKGNEIENQAIKDFTNDLKTKETTENPKAVEESEIVDEYEDERELQKTVMNPLDPRSVRAEARSRRKRSRRKRRRPKSKDSSNFKLNKLDEKFKTQN